MLHSSCRSGDLCTAPLPLTLQRRVALTLAVLLGMYLAYSTLYTRYEPTTCRIALLCNIAYMYVHGVYYKKYAASRKLQR